MQISGLMKMTLLDFPGHVACTIFTKGCNMRCPFCHNALLVTDTQNTACYTEEEIFTFLKKRTALLDGVAITGGEPLLQRDITDFIIKVRELGYKVKLDTNGSYPLKLQEICDKKLVDYIAMDIKNCLGKYSQTAGIDSFDINLIKQSIGIIMNSGIDYEFRTTVVNELHNVEDIGKAAELIKGAKRYFLQEFKDSGNLIGSGFTPVDRKTMDAMVKKAQSHVQLCEIRG